MFEIQVQPETSILKWQLISLRINLVWKSNIISDSFGQEKQVFLQCLRQTDTKLFTPTAQSEN